jgi:glycosyltransferase involved in cell wall biosynthesis
MSPALGPVQKPESAITVVLPTFNRRKWLQRAVESVLQETRVPILLHVFDNASTDGTEEYVLSAAAADSRIRYTRHPANVGGLLNYIGAFESIDTEYFVPLADDDWLLPDFLFDAYNQLEQSKELGAAIFVTTVTSENGTELGTYPTHLDKLTFGILTPQAHLRDWMRYGHYGWSSILWRKETLETIGRPYFHVGMPSDVDFQLQIFCRHPVCLTNRPGAIYFSHANQASRGYSLSDLRSWASLFKRLDRTMRENNIFDRREYTELRKLMQDRYRGIWNLRPETPLEDSKLLAVAIAAGFRLGDWELAFDLLNRFVASRANAEVIESIPNFVLPENTATSEAEAANHLLEMPGLFPSIMAWFRITTSKLRVLENQIEEHKAASLAPHPSNADIEPMRIELEKWRTRATAVANDNKLLEDKINSLRKERQERAGKSLQGRLRRWWRRVRGKVRLL